MTPEIIAIVTVGIALAGVILASTRGIRQDMARLESRLDGTSMRGWGRGWMGRIAALESSMNTQLGELRERMAHLEGLLEGLREAITGRARAS